MKKLALFLHLAVLACSAAPALATEITCGFVSSANSNTGDIRLQDGSRFKVSYPVLLKGVGPGSAVRITVNNNNTVGITQDNRFESPQQGGPGPCLAP